MLLAGTVLVCTKCDARALMKSTAAPDTKFEGQFHQCPGAFGMLAPLMPEGVVRKVEVLEPEDYVGGEMVQFGNHGRPVMALETTREDGTDRIVYAPTAVGRMS